MMNGSESSGWMDNPVAENIICSARKQKRAHVFNGLFLWRLVNSVQLFGVSTQRGSILILDTSRIASYRALRKEKKAMKLPRSTVVWCVLIVCLTLLAFTYLTRKSLCEIRLKDGNREVAAVLAYESGK